MKERKTRSRNAFGFRSIEVQLIRAIGRRSEKQGHTAKTQAAIDAIPAAATTAAETQYTSMHLILNINIHEGEREERTLRFMCWVLLLFFCYNISIKITHEITTIVNEHRAKIDTQSSWHNDTVVLNRLANER